MSLTACRTHYASPSRTQRDAERSPAMQRSSWFRGGARELVLVAALWVVYSASRMLADDDLAVARERAARILDVERLAHLDVESWLNTALTNVPTIAVPMSFWYASLHYLVTPAVLVFVFVRHRADYSRVRNGLVIGSAIGLVAYVLIPTAPPRLMGGHYVDTLAQYATYGWWSGHASAPAGLGGLTNELAAMPSLHVGWTVWVAWAMWRYVGRTGHLLSIAYVAGTTLVVIATGNHWLLDAVVGAAVVGVGIVAATRMSPVAQTAPDRVPSSW